MADFSDIGSNSIKSFVAAAPEVDNAATNDEGYHEPMHHDEGADTKQEVRANGVFSGDASDMPKFMRVSVEDDDVAYFAKEYKPTAGVVGCVADRDMLLRYMVSVERKYGVTVSFPACGVDPNIFDISVAEIRAESEGENHPPVVTIPVAGRATSEDNPDASEIYEKIEVDGIQYLSCASECLDRDYLHTVLAEATEAVFMHGEYIYTMVGPRPLVCEGDTEYAGKFIETLKLNSYELSVLLSYMQKIDGVVTSFGVYNGRSAIMFKR